MGNKYVITGSEIGMLFAYLDLNEPVKSRELLQNILDNKIILKK